MLEQESSGFSTVNGHIGYLRESWHGEPYATERLVPECFTDDEPGLPWHVYDEDGKYLGTRIPVATLLKRLPEAMATAYGRAIMIYRKPTHEALMCAKAYSDFVALCQKKEIETGEPVLIKASY